MAPSVEERDPVKAGLPPHGSGGGYPASSGMRVLGSFSMGVVLLLSLAGCGGATYGLRPDLGSRSFRYSGMSGNSRAPEVSGEDVGPSLPGTLLRSIPRGTGTTVEAAASAAGDAVVAGSAVVAAGSSVVLVCLTVKAASEGIPTPLDIADTFYGTHFADLQGWVQGCYASQKTPSLAISTPTPKIEPVPLQQRLEIHEERDKKNWGRVYATYTKFNPRTGRYYSGRTSMVIDLGRPLRPQAARAVDARDSNHHTDETTESEAPGFRPAQLDEFDVGSAVDYINRYGDIAYWRIRGREQQLIDSLGGAHCDTRTPYRTENVQRGVAKDNPLGRLFHDAATNYWGQLYPYTGD